ncbi:9840_t:CDS:2 [Paraglomus occultum]|uniref:9840_t:CDS:1 n=1 Tax=Paraglomus occultum TaxID=144539 RepID=A0A9N9BE37_9GLOM|nr:9840_t:CDS:2 [Paraglomus occultum]
MTETDVMELPPARIGFVIGAKGKTIAEIREQSKAHIYIDGHKAVIRGSEEARKEAMRLINRKVRIEVTLHPHIGYTVLELPESDTLPKLKFIPYNDVDCNAHTHGKRLYRVKCCDKDEKEFDIFSALGDSWDSEINLLSLSPSSPIQSSPLPLSPSSPSTSSSRSSQRLFEHSHSRSSSVTSVTSSPPPSSPIISSSLQNSLRALTDHARTFTIMHYIPEVISAVSSHLFKANPNISLQHEARLTVFFGRQTFSTISHSRMKTVEDWCDLNRERHGFQSSFQHYAPDMIKRIWNVLQRFGFEEVTHSRRKRSSMNNDVKTDTNDFVTNGEKNEDNEGNKNVDNDVGRKGSVCITYDDEDKVRKKIKLHWDYEEGVYKITKTTTQIRRVAIIDIVSGTSAPDIRFLLKTHKDEDIDEEKERLISDAQTPPLQLFDGTYFQSKHLKTKLDVDSIRQSITKRKFLNNRFQLSVITTRKEVRASRNKFAAPVEEQTINLKHLSWKMYQTNDEIRQVYDKESLEHSIRETVAFARKLCRILESEA